jgi:hypothetical protein
MYTVFQSAEVVEYMNDMGYNVSGISEREFYQGIGWSDDREGIDLGEKGKKDEDSFRLLKLILHFAVFFFCECIFPQALRTLRNSLGIQLLTELFTTSTLRMRYQQALHSLSFSLFSLFLSSSLLGHSLLSSLLLIMPSLSFFRYFQPQLDSKIDPFAVFTIHNVSVGFLCLGRSNFATTTTLGPNITVWNS